MSTDEPDQALVAAWMESLDYRLHQTFDGQQWVHTKSVITTINISTATFFYQAHVAAVAEAKVDQTRLLQNAQKKFGKIDFKAALYELENREKVQGYSSLQTNQLDEQREGRLLLVNQLLGNEKYPLGDKYFKGGITNDGQWIGDALYDTLEDELRQLTPPKQEGMDYDQTSSHHDI